MPDALVKSHHYLLGETAKRNRSWRATPEPTVTGWQIRCLQEAADGRFRFFTCRSAVSLRGGGCGAVGIAAGYWRCVGILLAGIAIGPWGLGFISDVDEILHFSELGVVFLMFIIGLELNPSKLWQLRRSIFGVGAAQVLLSAALLAGLLMLTDFAWQAAVVGGIGLAMSSTAMALQLMREKGMNRSESGS